MSGRHFNSRATTGKERHDQNQRYSPSENMNKFPHVQLIRLRPRKLCEVSEFT